MTKKQESTKRVALYVRVSTGEQTTDNQRLELERVARRSGWQVVEVYEDAGISGANGREKRPAFDQMLKAAARREFDLVAAWSVDRLGRSLQHLVAFLGELHALKVDLYLHQQGIDTTTPAGKAMFQMMGVFAEFERAMIQERINAGLARARAQGTRLGRPPGASKKRQAKRGYVLKLRQEGQSIRTIAKALKIAPGTVQGILKEARQGLM